MRGLVIAGAPHLSCQFANSKPMEMNCIIELHDSWIARIASSDNSIMLQFGPAWIHRSVGRPGFDPGTAWLQDVELIIANAIIESNVAEFPCQLDTGYFSVDGNIFENEIPLPVQTQGDVRLVLETKFGEKMVIGGNGMTMGASGQVVYVEDFPGTDEVSISTG